MISKKIILLAMVSVMGLSMVGYALGNSGLISNINEVNAHTDTDTETKHEAGKAPFTQKLHNLLQNDEVEYRNGASDEKGVFGDNTVEEEEDKDDNKVDIENNGEDEKDENTDDENTNETPKVKITTNIENLTTESIIKWEYEFIDEDKEPSEYIWTLDGKTYNDTTKVPNKLTEGIHIIKIKAKDSNGVWSKVDIKEFKVSLDSALEEDDSDFPTEDDDTNSDSGSSSTPDTTLPESIKDKWHRVIGTSVWQEIYSVQQTADGGYITVGITNATDGDFEAIRGEIDALILKFDSQGEIEWYKIFGGSKDDYFDSVQLTDDGGYIVAGSTESTDGDFEPSKGNFDTLIVKFDEKGNMEWNKVLGSSRYEYFYSIDQTKDGGYIAVGEGDSVDDGDFDVAKGFSDAIIVKFDNKGNTKWHKVLGGSKTDRFNSVLQTPDGGCIAVGATYSTDGDFNPSKGSYDVLIVKFNNNGDIDWHKVYGGSDWDVLNSIQQTSDGGYIIAGEGDSTDGDFTTGIGGEDTLLLKLDRQGNIEWYKIYGGAEHEIFNSVVQTKDGGYMAVGYTDSTDGDFNKSKGYNDALIVKFDDKGNIEWHKVLGGSDDNEQLNLIKLTSDGGFIVVGYARSTNGEFDKNEALCSMLIAKFDKNAESDLNKPIYKTISGYFSNEITHREQTVATLNTNFTENVTFSVGYNISSEGLGDEFSILVDGQEVFTTSGDEEDTFTCELPSGSRKIEFKYTKDRNISEGRDNVYLTNIKFVGATTNIEEDFKDDALNIDISGWTRKEEEHVIGWGKE